MNIKIEKTADGSPTLYREDIDEHYHSVKGALAESQHVFINCGWNSVRTCIQHVNEGQIRVFEVGFGSGLNAALTCLAATQSKMPTRYYSVELYPLSPDTVDILAAGLEEEYRESFYAVNRAAWGELIQITPYFTLIKLNDSLITMPLPNEMDVVYFDAFSPEKQPEMWSEQIFKKIFEVMTPGALLTTYCAKGNIRRLLQQIGFITERLPGPPGGKREILRAAKQIAD